MKITANEIRVGMLLEYKNDLWEVLKTQHVKPGKGGAFAQVEMKSINKNTKLKSDTDFVQKLLEKENVAVVQGSAFGLEGYFRISYATSDENLKNACVRMRDFLNKLR